MNRFFIFTSFFIFSFSLLGNTPKISLEEYIETWKDVAINKMISHGVPASITLSQGILESGFGNSKLAQQANNHFGIKCHDWTGETFLKDDDKKNECFRKYKDAAQSFEDHSHFLTSRSRYAFLFELEVTDYKAWARGLKKAGYATHPKYPKRLIDIIERYELYQYDELTNNDWIAENQAKKDNQEKTKEDRTIIIVEDQPEKKVSPTKKFNSPKSTQATKSISTISSPAAVKHKVFTNMNRTQYVVAGKHDTFYLIAKEFGLSLRQLNRWNDFPRTKDVLSEGDKIYIMRKRKRIKSERVHNDLHNSNKALWKIAQEYGIQLKSLASIDRSNSSSMAERK